MSALPLIDTQPPIVVELEGELVRTHLGLEAVFARLGRDPVAAVLGWVRGEAAAPPAPEWLPYDPTVLTRLRREAASGRAVYLSADAPAAFVEAVARHLGVFAGWFTPHEAADGGSRSVAASTYSDAGGVERLPSSASRRPVPSDWLRLVRPHQYAKNALVFVPVLTSHQLGLGTLGAALLALAAFSLCASGVYILNDLVDLEADRQHPRKRERPLASGAIPLAQGLVAAPVLLALSGLMALAVSLPFLGVLSGYFALTLAYSLVLKRKMLIDAVTLAMLYTARVVGGAVAIGVPLSEWLLMFSMFLFMSLALIKRYVELAVRADGKMSDMTNRNYKIGDLEVVAALAAAAGFNAVTVFSLYLSSPAVRELYPRPYLLWLICPILLYWIGRALLMGHRRYMHDDPIVFALKDKNSLAAGAIIVALMVAASW